MAVYLWARAIPLFVGFLTAFGERTLVKAQIVQPKTGYGISLLLPLVVVHHSRES